MFTLADIEAAARLDLFDPTGTNQRWQTSDIDRAIDKAVDRYSAVYPNIVFVDLQSQPYQRTYPYPSAWRAGYPALWIEKVLFPLQYYGSSFAAPTAAPTAAAVSGSGLGSGVYQYGVSFVTPGGETTISPLASVTTSGGNLAVTLSSIPIGPSQSPLAATPVVAANLVIARNIYRTQVGGSSLTLLATLQDNTTTTYSDTTPDATIASQPAPPTVNTSGVMLWPPYEREFAEYSNLFDTDVSLAAGGNMATNDAPGIPAGSSGVATGTVAPSFTLKLSGAELPQDTTSVLRVFYATKHQLDGAGTTIPEIHRDVIVLGAAAYAIQAYQVPTNDNFDFQDGTLRDKVDDTAIPKAWLALGAAKMADFEGKLVAIKEQRDFASATRVHWGDVPVRWNRL